MKNNFIINDTFYKSDSIKNGRRVKSFFRKLAQNLFDQSILFYEKNLSITGVKEYPLFFDDPADLGHGEIRRPSDPGRSAQSVGGLFRRNARYNRLI